MLIWHLCRRRGLESRINVDRTVNLDYDYHPDSVTVSTRKSFRIAGPDTQDPAIGKYIDPLADENFTARIYLFKSGKPGHFRLPLSAA